MRIARWIQRLEGEASLQGGEMRNSTQVMRIGLLVLAGLVAATPAAAQDPLGINSTGGGPTPIVEGLLGTAILVSSCPAPVSQGV
ncbi:MAG TPA: hypothetical protein VFG08_02040, partial [Candidatus Polarisedimenticolia bacterium]|nr:hypothetical protein [Candidatus Polarisedimenticolia bacterium]